MPIVSNTSPILNLAAVGYLRLLESQFGEIVVPQAVCVEMKRQAQECLSREYEAH